ncbi:MAG TPA: hypothetical protein VJC03_03000 [bacterium]|nr:hypothetical protein [bacterium]
METIFHEKFIVDEKGKRTAVVIGAKEYAKILTLLKEAKILRIARQGEKEFRNGKLKAIRSLSELDR